MKNIQLLNLLPSGKIHLCVFWFFASNLYMLWYRHVFLLIVTASFFHFPPPPRFRCVSRGSISVRQRTVHSAKLPVRRIRRLSRRQRRAQLHRTGVSRQIPVSTGRPEQTAQVHQQVSTMRRTQGLRRQRGRRGGLLWVYNDMISRIIIDTFKTRRSGEQSSSN